MVACRELVSSGVPMTPGGTYGECSNVCSFFIARAKAKGTTPGFQAIHSGMMRFLSEMGYVHHSQMYI